MLEPEDMPTNPNLDVPNDVYVVLVEPAVLAGMKYPTKVSGGGLYELGIRHIIPLTEIEPPYDLSPLAGATSRFELQDLVYGDPPKDVQRELDLIREATRAVLAHVRRGEGVAVHCEGGTGRTGTVLGCALVRMGNDPDSVISYLDRVHRARKKPGWPEALWQAEVVRSARLWVDI
ncbi:MAG: dual specificity protein phosphatase family protein [Acidobacteria bacterium]|nr:dual specificity protein phosphatase family protein [Acidobacteriota bacterium]